MWLTLYVFCVLTDPAMLEMKRPDPSDRDLPVAASPRQPIREHRAALPGAALADVPPSA